VQSISPGLQGYREQEKNKTFHNHYHAYHFLHLYMFCVRMYLCCCLREMEKSGMVSSEMGTIDPRLSQVCKLCMRLGIYVIQVIKM